MRLRHPYAAFPVDRLEAAVNAVPLDSFPVVEREAAVFGPAYKFWCAHLTCLRKRILQAARKLKRHLRAVHPVMLHERMSCRTFCWTF